MKDLSRYKIDYFKIAKNNQSVFFVETENYASVFSTLHLVLKTNLTVAFVKSQGCGVSLAIEYFQKKNTRYSHIIDASSSFANQLSELLYALGYDFRPHYKFEGTNTKHMTNALLYHFKQFQSVPKRFTIIFDDIHLLTESELRKRIQFMIVARSLVNFSLVSSKAFLERAMSQSSVSKHYNQFMKKLDDWKVLPPIHFEERCSICYLFGIEDQRLIDLLAKENENLNSLYSKLRRIKRISLNRVTNS